jgi:uncharacterized membrane protein YjjP (DUF1212 family)
VGVGWVLHARRSCYPLNFTETLIRSHIVWNYRSYDVMKLTHSFAAAGTCSEVQRRMNRLTVSSSPPIATLVANLSCCFIAALVNLSICNFNLTGTTSYKQGILKTFVPEYELLVIFVKYTNMYVYLYTLFICLYFIFPGSPGTAPEGVVRLLKPRNIYIYSYICLFI